MKEFDVCVIGSGMAGITSACLLAQKGMRVGLLEQNWIPGGCTSAYPRKGYIFETGATTLVGLDPHMPLKYLIDQTGVKIKSRKLEIPMSVYLKDGRKIIRHQNLEAWIKEAEQIFGNKNQRKFWEDCFKVSQFVWETSLKQKMFPPSRFSDLLHAAKNVNLQQFQFAKYAFISMKDFLSKYELLENQTFVDFINEQLLITAQNHMEEVNVLFGATALCYTNYSNYYVDGGLINLVNPFIDYLQEKNGELQLRTEVTSIEKNENGYQIYTKKEGEYRCKYLISAIPINNTLPLFKNGTLKKVKEKILGSKSLNSAFQMGIAFKNSNPAPIIHHQIHLETPLNQVGAKSIFLSLNHPEDTSRSQESGISVASVSCHIADPENNYIHHKEKVEKEIIHKLESLDFLQKENIVYQHSSTAKSWQKWTKRAFGFVGGYPQYMHIKPWQMNDARLDQDKAYICGDTTYPGQGIPGATLSGIIAVEKLTRDHL
ncbi:phytoene desaturase family protein [Flexithrix dorotheae]|uniref:phytoene desaturase family protein n=1 Tax=Flexithrix dorotheae TaxID=70993 RepID=UPI000363EA0D|nr:NAD(P)/FAD-dependent oxidoreductase [Flexithrix dorotheae]